MLGGMDSFALLGEPEESWEKPKKIGSVGKIALLIWLAGIRKSPGLLTKKEGLKTKLGQVMRK